MRPLREQLETLARDQGIVAFGVADLEAFRGRRPGAFCDVADAFASRAVVCAMAVGRRVLATIRDRPTPLYMHHYRQLNFALDRIALAMAQRLEAAGWEALAIPASQILRRDPMLGHVSHRELAYQAGLGWRGRNNLLVSPGFGSAVRLVSILTDAPLAADTPTETTCAAIGCSACAAVCPAGAIGGEPADFDLPACAAKLGEFTRLPFIGQHICGVCVKACQGPRQSSLA